MAGVDFSLNVVLDSARRVVRAFAGEIEAAHEAACRFVRGAACPRVERPADVVVTSCGGSPLDATFYQCVKGLVSCLPAVKPGGTIIALAGCSEGVGSPEYSGLMRRYSGAWRRFLDDIRRPGFFVKDQWQFQMHARALEKVGEEKIIFITPGLGREELRTLSVSGIHAPGGASAVAREVGEAIERARRAGARSFAAIPDGPYCAPMAGAAD
jgi:nickel-dependent lactate racemase